MQLTKEQLTKLDNIFHNRHDAWTFDQSNSEPAATFSTVVDIVEEFLDKLTVIQWKKYQEEKPEQSGLHLVCAFGQVRSGYYNDLKEVWRYSASDFAELEAVTHWAYFPDAVIPSTE